MYNGVLFVLLSNLICISFSNKVHNVFFYSDERLNNLFLSRLCITEDDIPLEADDGIASLESEDSAMGRVHELAKYNNVEYEYVVVSVDGPEHSRWFTVTLRLGDPRWDLHWEEHTGYGSKIKDAQRNAAKKALSDTSFTVKHKQVQPDLNDNNDCEEENSPSCRLSHLIGGANIRYTKYKPKMSQMHGVQLVLEHKMFVGEAYTLPEAKQQAAVRALEYLNNEDRDTCAVVDQEPEQEELECTALKSPVTLLYEIAQRYKYHLVCSVVDQEGPPHQKVFTTSCKMEDFESTGQGSSKKMSKVRAAEGMLGTLSELGYSMSGETSQRMHNKHNRKRNNILKVTSDDDELNPITVLYEWSSQHPETGEVVFRFEDQLEGEGKERRYRAVCQWGGKTTSGVGHRKKVAKHNAALAMLDLLQIPHSEKIESKETLLRRQYIPGLLKAPDYLTRAGISPENEAYGTKSNRLTALNKKLKKAAEYFTKQDNENKSTESVLEIDKENPVKQLEEFLEKIHVKSEFISLPVTNAGVYSSIVWLLTKPQLLCYGGPGGTKYKAQELSAMATMAFLSELTTNTTGALE